MPFGQVSERALVKRLNLTALYVTHDQDEALSLADRIVVLEFGKKIAEGSPAEIRDNPAVIAAYLGEPDDAA